MSETDFKRLYDQTSKLLLSYLIRVSNDKALADDVFQESYIRVLHGQPDDTSDAKLKSFLFTVATNILRDHWRRAKKSIPWQAEGRGDISTIIGSEIEGRLDMENVLLKLPPQQRSLLWLAYVEGYSHKEIGEMLKIGEKSVRVLLFRAKQKLAGIIAAIAGKESR